MEILKTDHPEAVARIRADCAELFWDIDASRLDLEEHSKLIITQVLNYGFLTAVQHLFKVWNSLATLAEIRTDLIQCPVDTP